MATFAHKVGRRLIHFTDHALDRWWERCQQNDIHGRQHAMNLLREKLDGARWTHDLPSWSRLSRWHRALAEGFLWIDDDSGFVVNKNLGECDRVAVTYIDRIDRPIEAVAA